MDGSRIMSLKSKLGLNYGKCPTLVQQTIQSLYNNFQGIIEVLKTSSHNLDTPSPVVIAYVLCYACLM